MRTNIFQVLKAVLASVLISLAFVLVFTLISLYLTINLLQPISIIVYFNPKDSAPLPPDTSGSGADGNKGECTRFVHSPLF